MSTDASGAASRSAEPRFFRNYNRTIAVAYGALLLGLALFFGYQLRVTMDQELAVIQGEVERHGQHLEFVLRSSADQAEALRMAAGRAHTSEDAAPRRCATPERLLLASLREEQGGFHRDALAQRDGGGNLVGTGRLAGRRAEFYCDLEAALSLDGHLQSMPFHLPNVARTRFLAVEGFQLVSPWRPAREAPFVPKLFEDPVWTLGQAQVNPERRKFWGPPYFAGEETGLLAPVAAPVYDRQRFMGVVSIDLSLDYLHRVNGRFGYPLGTVSIVDAQGRVLAHPALYADPLWVRAAADMGQVLPASIASAERLATLPAGTPVLRDGVWLVRHAFTAAPWQMVYSVPQVALWSKLAFEHAPPMLAVLVAMALLMVITYAVSSREFVGPAAQLVRHLVAESNFQPQPVPRVPAAWRPWFDAITRAFRQSMELGVLRKELDIAARMQQSILPRHWPQDPRFGLWGMTAAAREVGGDFYDHFAIDPQRIGLVVADVSGKGIAAGLFAMVSKTLLRAVAVQRQAAPDEVAQHVNNGLCVDNDSSMFVTAFFAQYEPPTGRLAYVNAGHPPPLLVDAKGAARWLPARGGCAFGVMDDAPYAQAEIQLAPGELLLMFSDGVNEAENAQGEPFGLERVLALYQGRPVVDAREAVQRLVDCVQSFASGVEQFDDITCLALCCTRWGDLQ
jgi:phosphoserine phosphatase RsbU/P